MTAIVVPRRGRGRPSRAASAAYDNDVARFCQGILEIRSSLDFSPGARGWGYYLEGLRSINKDELDTVEAVINNCRKDGNLPLDICAVDETRSFEGVEEINSITPEREAEGILDYIDCAPDYYHPYSFWDFQDCYIQMTVEKIDLKSLFAKICAEFHIPIANAKGWNDLNTRAEMMRRFSEWEAKGKKTVLLYCGDFDPGGFQISSFLRSNMQDMARAVGWSPDNLIIDRFGLNIDYIRQHGLVWIENLITSSGERLDDPRHPDHRKPYVQDYIKLYGARKVEANALLADPVAGRALCRSAILKYIDLDRISAFDAATEAKREIVKAEVERLLRERAA